MPMKNTITSWLFKAFGILTAISLLLGLPATIPAADFPSKPAKIIVAFPPGAATDIVGRIVAQKLTEMWGQPVIVDNRAGAAGTIGTDVVAKAAPDGYTMLLGTLGNLAANPSLYRNLPFSMERDFIPVSLVVMVHFVMVVHPSVPAKTVKELIALAKAKPGELNYSSSGAGGLPHLAGELFKSMAGVKVQHIGYKGSVPSFTDLLGGRITYTIDNLPLALQYIKSGKLRALAVVGPKRQPMLPDVPTMVEAGIPGYVLTNWFGMVVPAGTPRNAVQRINSDIAKIMQMPDVRERLYGMAAEPVGSTQEHFSAFLKAETAMWAKVIKDGNITAE
jgi:tripartite-type tricarboxylate transporter receptor subunit TctC